MTPQPLAAQRRMSPNSTAMPLPSREAVGSSRTRTRTLREKALAMLTSFFWMNDSERTSASGRTSMPSSSQGAQHHQGPGPVRGQVQRGRGGLCQEVSEGIIQGLKEQNVAR